MFDVSIYFIIHHSFIPRAFFITVIYTNEIDIIKRVSHRRMILNKSQFILNTERRHFTEISAAKRPGDFGDDDNSQLRDNPEIMTLDDSTRRNSSISALPSVKSFSAIFGRKSASAERHRARARAAGCPEIPSIEIARRTYAATRNDVPESKHG